MNKNDMVEIVKNKIRAVTDADIDLPRISYSKLECFLNCPYQFQKKYSEGKYPEGSTIALDVGTICHLILELKGQEKIQNKKCTNYEALFKILEEGFNDNTEKSHEHIKGINELKKEYWEDWYTKDNKSNMNYEEKIELFKEVVVPTRMTETDWLVKGTEVPFKFVYDNRVIVVGFIDRIDEHKETGALRIVDYKTSKAKFDETKIKTPMQHIFYDMACMFMYDKLPMEHEYDFILINEKQTSADGVCSKGYLKRGIKKLDDTLDKIEEAANTKKYLPKPTPLCYWCPYHTTSPNADNKYKGLCVYHSLWTPECRIYTTLNPYCSDEKKRTFNF